MTKKTFENIFTAVSVLLVILIPTVFSVRLNSIFTAPKLLILQTLLILMLLVCGYYCLSNKRVKLAGSPWEKYLWIYVLVALLSAIFSINVYSGFFGIAGRFIGTFTLIHLALLAILTFKFFPKNRIPLLLNVTFVTAVFVALYSIAQYYGLIKFEGINWTQNPNNRAFGTFGHANHLAAYVSTAIAVSVGLMAYYKNYRQRALLILGNIILITALTLTGSRGGFAALILTLILLAILLFRMSGDFLQKELIKSFYITTGIILVLLIIFPLGKTFINKLPLVERSLQTIESLQNGNTVDRLSWWKSSFEMFKHSPLLGTGYGTFKDAYNQYRRLDYRLPDDIQDGITPESAHNELINTLATQGLVGLAAYLLMVFYPIWQLSKYIWRKNLLPQKDKYIALSILGALSVYILQTQISFGVISTITFFYLFLGLAVLISGGQNETIKFNKFISLAIIIAFSISSLTLANKRFRAEYFLQKADSAIQARDKEKFYEKTIKSFPWDYTYHAAYADYTLGALMQARPDVSLEKYLALSINNYKNALELNDAHPVIWANYANSLLTKANYKKLMSDEKTYAELKTKGLKAFEIATAKGPNNPLFTYHYAQALEKMGMPEEAKLQYQKTLEIRDNYKEELFEQPHENQL